MQPTVAGGVSPNPSSLDIIGRTRKVIEYSRDSEQTGRPVLLLIAGEALALFCLILIVGLYSQSFYEHRISENRGYFGISLLFVFYVLGVFLYCYGYELYDIQKALRLTIIASLLTVVFIILATLSAATLLKMGETASSYVDAGPDAEEEEAQLERDGFKDLIRPDGPLLFITCQGCQEKFMPVPPKAICPNCGRAALTG